jgi:hypothetical protein
MGELDKNWLKWGGGELPRLAAMLATGQFKKCVCVGGGGRWKGGGGERGLAPLDKGSVVSVGWLLICTTMT